MHELMFQAGVKGMSERSGLIPCNIRLQACESDDPVPIGACKLTIILAIAFNFVQCM